LRPNRSSIDFSSEKWLNVSTWSSELDVTYGEMSSRPTWPPPGSVPGGRVMDGVQSELEVVVLGGVGVVVEVVVVDEVVHEVLAVVLVEVVDGAVVVLVLVLVLVEDVDVVLGGLGRFGNAG
jgi:hypothetical protein